MKTPISYYGGKQNMLNNILPMIPQHKIYIEPFFGGGAVYFAKQPAEINVINDMDDKVINFYEVLKNHFVELNNMIQATLHSETHYKRAKKTLKTGNNIERAWGFWVQTNMSCTNQINNGFAFGKDPRYKNTTNKKQYFINYQNALENTYIFNRDALNIIKTWDDKDAFYYVDPPYYNSDCGHYKGYTETDFCNLLDLLATIKGKFLLSCYPSKILQDAIKLNGWKSRQIVKNLSAGQNRAGKTKTECLTYNYKLENTLFD